MSGSATEGPLPALPEIRNLRTDTGDPQVRALFNVRCSRRRAENVKVTPELFCKVFKEYTHVTAANGKPIHIIAQGKATQNQIRHVQIVVAMMLADSGCSGCVAKAAIGNAAADSGLIIAILDSEEASKRVEMFWRTGLLDQPLFVNEVTPRGCDRHRRGEKDATWEEVLHNIQNAGIRVAAPEFQFELDTALEAALLAGRYVPDDDYDSWTLVSQEFFAVAMEAYFGMSETRPDGLSGGEYTFIRRRDMEANDPQTCELICRFFRPDSGLPIHPDVPRPCQRSDGGLPQKGQAKVQARESARRWWAAVALLRCERLPASEDGGRKALLCRVRDLLCDPAFEPKRASRRSRSVPLRAAAARAALRQLDAAAPGEGEAEGFLRTLRREMGLRTQRLPREEELERRVRAFLLDFNRLRAQELEAGACHAFDELFVLFAEAAAEGGSARLSEAGLRDLLVAAGFDGFDEADQLARALCSGAGGSVDRASFKQAVCHRAQRSDGGRRRGPSSSSGSGRSRSGSISGSSRGSSTSRS